MDIKLDDAGMKALVSEAILQSLDAQKRDALIKEALAYLLEPKRDAYGSRLTPLQDAFREAVSNFARRTVEEMFEKETAIRDDVLKLIKDSWAALMSDQRYPKLVTKFGEAISSALTGRDY